MKNTNQKITLTFGQLKKLVNEGRFGDRIKATDSDEFKHDTDLNTAKERARHKKIADGVYEMEKKVLAYKEDICEAVRLFGSLVDLMDKRHEYHEITEEDFELLNDKMNSNLYYDGGYNFEGSEDNDLSLGFVITDRDGACMTTGDSKYGKWQCGIKMFVYNEKLCFRDHPGNIYILGKIDVEHDHPPADYDFWEKWTRDMNYLCLYIDELFERLEEWADLVMNTSGIKRDLTNEGRFSDKLRKLGSLK